MLTTTTGVATIIPEVTAVVTGAVGWIGQFVGVVTENPLILMFVIVSFVGLGVGLLRRLMGL